MAQGDIITKGIKQIIAEVWLAHLKKGGAPAKVIQADVARIVQEKWPRRYKPDWPGLRAVQDHLVIIRGIYTEKHQELEKVWNLGIDKQQDKQLRSEAIAYVFKLKEWAERHNQEPITVRQAYWIGRFYPAISDIRRAKDKDIEHLYNASWVYAHYELVCDLAGDDFDTTELDQAFWHGGMLQFFSSLIDRDIVNGTRYVKKASDMLAGRKVENERTHNKKR